MKYLSQSYIKIPTQLVANAHATIHTLSKQKELIQQSIINNNKITNVDVQFFQVPDLKVLFDPSAMYIPMEPIAMKYPLREIFENFLRIFVKTLSIFIYFYFLQFIFIFIIHYI